MRRLFAVCLLVLVGGVAAHAQTARVSVSAAGAEGNAGSAGGVSLSQDGRYVAFGSAASNLVPGDTNGASDVFVRDRLTGQVSRVSVGPGGVQADGDSSQPSISFSGRYVAFESTATNLVSDKANLSCGTPPRPCRDVYVHDRELRLTTRVSLSSSGQEANGDSRQAAISGFGDAVAFTSSATTLVDGDTNGADDVFVHARWTLQTTRVSVGKGGAQAVGGAEWAGSSAPAIGADGRHVAYQSQAANLVDGTLAQCSRYPLPAGTCDHIYLYDRSDGITQLLSGALGGSRPAIVSVSPDLIDGEPSVVFSSAPQSFAPPGPGETAAPFVHEVYVSLYGWRYTPTGAQLMRTTTAFGQTFPSPAWLPPIAVAAAAAGSPFVLDRGDEPGVVGPSRGLTTWFPLLPPVTAPPSPALLTWTDIAASGDGKIVAFITNAVDAVPGDTNGVSDVFVVNPDDPDGDGLPPGWELTWGFDPYKAEGSADPDGDGSTNAEEFAAGSHPTGRAAFTRYFAEGAIGTFLSFTTGFALFNPSATDTAHVMVRCMNADSSTGTYAVIIPPRSTPQSAPWVYDRTSCQSSQFSTLIESDALVVAERTMTWGYLSGAHAETAVTSPSPVWYLAEGSTVGGFSLFYLLQNPSETPARVRVRYLRPSGGPLEKTYDLPPTSRTNIWVNQEAFPGLGRALASTDVSAVFEVLQGPPIVVERAMYLDLPRQVFGAGHGSAGVTAPALEWFLAEGATGRFFDLFVLVANPAAQDATIEATYLLPDGTVLTKAHTVAGNGRFTIHVDAEDRLLADTAVSTTIRTTNGVPVIVERSMWWPGSAGEWYGAHNSPGATAAGTMWAVAGGANGVIALSPYWPPELGRTASVASYILVGNVSPTPATVRVTVFRGTQTLEKTFVLAPHSRFNLDVLAEFPPQGTSYVWQGGALVESLGDAPAQIVVERAMYWSLASQPWTAGTNALATRLK